MAKKEIKKLTPKEVESKIIELGKKGITSEKIGLILRDQYGIPKAKLFGKKICKILESNNIETKTEYKNINKKIENLNRHFIKHKHDWYAKRRITQYSSRIRKLSNEKITAKN